ncbi:MAG: hypothetical protein U0V72_02860 [Cytophagales bacterium]
MKTFLFTIITCVLLFSCSKKNIELSTNVNESYQRKYINIGISYENRKGLKKSTKGLLNGKVPWLFFDITTPFGTVKQGILKYNYAALEKYNYILPVKIKYNNGFKTDSITENIFFSKIQNIEGIQNQNILVEKQINLNFKISLDNGTSFYCNQHELKNYIKNLNVVLNDKEIDIKSLETFPYHCDMLDSIQQIKITKDQKVLCEFDVKLIYPNQYYFNFTGNHGFNGGKGYLSLVDLFFINGKSYYYNSSGQNGVSASPFKIYLSNSAKDTNFAVAIIERNNEVFSAVINKKLNTSKITIDAYGGNGGNGSDGMRGNDGSNGTDKASPTNGTAGGNGGNGGNGGHGADVTFIIEEGLEWMAYSCFTINNNGGSGGSGGNGGRGGRNGSPVNPKTLDVISDILGANRANSGSAGANGMYGTNGQINYQTISKTNFNSLKVRLAQKF